MEEEEDGLRCAVIEHEDERDQQDQRGEHDDRIVADLRTGRPRNLAKLAAGVAEELCGVGDRRAASLALAGLTDATSLRVTRFE